MYHFGISCTRHHKSCKIARVRAHKVDLRTVKVSRLEATLGTAHAQPHLGFVTWPTLLSSSRRCRSPSTIVPLYIKRNELIHKEGVDCC